MQGSFSTLLLIAAGVANSCVTAADNDSSETVTIYNNMPHIDVNGNIMDAHDGNIVQWEPNGPYYFYGMSYGMCKENNKGCGGTGGTPNCGFNTNHNVSVWTSMNLMNHSWQYVSNALPVDGGRPSAIYYRPKVKYNRVTKQYVMWINGVPAGDFSHSFYLTATSSTPEGPFSVVHTDVQTAYAGGGDFDILVDDDDKAYIIYTSVPNGHNMSVEQLSADYLTSAKVSSGFFGETFVEAPVMFKRDNVYYALFGHCCCFCQEGSGAFVYTASHPLGPWTPHPNINCDYNKPMPSPYGCSVDHGSSISKGQLNCVFPVTTTAGTEYILTFDQWQSATDGIKAHDTQYWTPLKFDNGTIQQLTYLDSFQIVGLE